MNRQERRRAERKTKKELEVLKKLPESEVIKINNIIEKVATQRNNEMITALDTSLTALLISKGYKFKEVCKLQDELSELLDEDVSKTRILVKENVNMEKLQKEVKEFMVKEIKDRQAKGEKQSAIKKEVIEATIFKFPKLSKAKATIAYGKIMDEMELEEAAEYILEEKKAKEIAEEVSKELEKEIEKGKEEDKMSRFKINKQEIIKKLEFEGENGKYKAETGVGVELQANGVSLAFSTVEDLDKFYEEYRQAFELI